jgi:hypothetical protein
MFVVDTIWRQTMEEPSKTQSSPPKETYYRFYAWIFAFPYAAMEIYKKLSYLLNLPRMPEVLHNYGTDVFFPAGFAICITLGALLFNRDINARRAAYTPRIQMFFLAAGTLLALAYEVGAAWAHTVTDMSNTTLGRFEWLDVACILGGSLAAFLFLLYHHRKFQR